MLDCLSSDRAYVSVQRKTEDRSGKKTYDLRKLKVGP